LKKKSVDDLRRFLITSMLRIRKSCFLIYILIQLLCEDVVVIFQPLNDNYFYCLVTCKAYDNFLFLLSLPTGYNMVSGRWCYISKISTGNDCSLTITKQNCNKRLSRIWKVISNWILYRFVDIRKIIILLEACFFTSIKKNSN
jgi:hypothetical protein